MPSQVCRVKDLRKHEPESKTFRFEGAPEVRPKIGWRRVMLTVRDCPGPACFAESCTSSSVLVATGVRGVVKACTLWCVARGPELLGRNSSTCPTSAPPSVPRVCILLPRESSSRFVRNRNGVWAIQYNIWFVIFAKPTPEEPPLAADVLKKERKED